MATSFPKVLSWDVGVHHLAWGILTVNGAGGSVHRVLDAEVIDLQDYMTGAPATPPDTCGHPSAKGSCTHPVTWLWTTPTTTGRTCGVHKRAVTTVQPQATWSAAPAAPRTGLKDWAEEDFVCTLWRALDERRARWPDDVDMVLVEHHDRYSLRIQQTMWNVVAWFSLRYEAERVRHGRPRVQRWLPTTKMGILTKLLNTAEAERAATTTLSRQQQYRVRKTLSVRWAADAIAAHGTPEVQQAWTQAHLTKKQDDIADALLNAYTWALRVHGPGEPAKPRVPGRGRGRGKARGRGAAAATATATHGDPDLGTGGAPPPVRARGRGRGLGRGRGRGRGRGKTT